MKNLEHENQRTTREACFNKIVVVGQDFLSCLYPKSLHFIFTRCLTSNCFCSTFHWHFISIPSKAVVSDFNNVFIKWNLIFRTLRCFKSMFSGFLSLRLEEFISRFYSHLPAICLTEFVSSGFLLVTFFVTYLVIPKKKTLFLKVSGAKVNLTIETRSH